MTQETAIAPHEQEPDSRLPVPVGVQPLVVDQRYVETTIRSLKVLRGLVSSVLQRDIDYGHIPGTQGESLFEPGASTIIASFNCHVGKRRVLSLVDTDQKIAVVLEVPIISNITGQEVGNGIGAGSTQEVKNKYRWVEDPQEWGYGEEDIEVLKTKVEYGKTKYRVLNPEPGELLNIVIKAASKRAEVDAAQGLPGAATALREMFKGKVSSGKEPPSGADGEPGDDSTRWTSFW
jgi:hypothetical protein